MSAARTGVLVCLLLSACATDDAPTTADVCEPVSAAEVTTIENCECHGGTLRPWNGGTATCRDGELQLATVRFGIEGGLCCGESMP